MKLSTSLTIAGQPVHLIDHDLVLDLNAGGRAALTIEGSANKGQTFTLDTGYSGDLRGLLAWLTDQTGLTFLLPKGADYTDRPIPNFTSAGTGYQLLDNAGRAFQVPDFVWYPSSWAAMPIAAGMTRR